MLAREVSFDAHMVSVAVSAGPTRYTSDPNVFDFGFSYREECLRGVLWFPELAKRRRDPEEAIVWRGQYVDWTPGIGPPPAIAVFKNFRGWPEVYS